MSTSAARSSPPHLVTVEQAARKKAEGKRIVQSECREFNGLGKLLADHVGMQDTDFNDFMMSAPEEHNPFDEAIRRALKRDKKLRVPYYQLKASAAVAARPAVAVLKGSKSVDVSQ